MLKEFLTIAITIVFVVLCIYVMWKYPPTSVTIDIPESFGACRNCAGECSSSPLRAGVANPYYFPYSAGECILDPSYQSTLQGIITPTGSDTCKGAMYTSFTPDHVELTN
jgi:hypothetical protein